MANTNPTDPQLFFIDYTVSGDRAAAAVAAGRSRLVGMSYQNVGAETKFVPETKIAEVLHGLAGRPRLYNDALFGLAVEACNELPSPPGVGDIDDLRTMLQIVYGGDPTKIDAPSIDRSELAKLAIDRTNHPLTLFSRLSRQIESAGTSALYRDIELPILAPTLAMTLGGVPVHRSVLESINEGRATQMQIVLRQLEELAGRPINLDSSPELIHYLYDELKLSPPQYTHNGNPSTSNASLSRLINAHPVVALILAYQENKPLRDTANTLLDHLEPDGRVYAELDPLGAATGRYSCSKPNMQGVAVPLRRAIVALPGHVLLEADYSQMELRVLAHFSQDPSLRDAFKHNIDLHTRTAAQVVGYR